MIKDFVTFGIAATMLRPASFDSVADHLEAIKAGCALEGYQSLELFISDDARVAAEEVKMLRDSGKSVNYNAPMPFQLGGDCNPGNPDPVIRKNAIALAHKHLDYAAQAGSKLFCLAPCPDEPTARDEAKQAYREFLTSAAEYAYTLGITLAIEPVERHRFKKLLLGSTAETAQFIQVFIDAGIPNIKLMLDFAHLPLMEETTEDALPISMKTGLVHVHMGNAVLKPESVYYGHTHPPIGIPDGLWDVEDIADQFAALIKAGYISLTPSAAKPTVSLEVRPYSGVCYETSAKFAYEKVAAAFEIAVGREK